MILPDDGSGNAISSPIRSYVNAPVDQPVIGPVASTDVPLNVPPPGREDRGPAMTYDVDDHDQQFKLHKRKRYGNHRQPHNR